MEKLTLLDTAVGSTNRGDEIIMQCVEEELEWLIQKYFVLRTPTHLRGFGIDECIGQLPDSASEIYRSKYKFVCGTNLLSGNMKNRTNQWDINLLNCKPIIGSILIGVGGGGEVDNKYTEKLYKKILSKEYIHSVRDDKAYKLVTSLGLKCFNTGCVTMWKLTPEFCAMIPKKKANNAVITLTDYNKNPEIDKMIVETVLQKYEQVSFWVQGAHDLEYLQSLVDIDQIKVLPSTVRAYEAALNEQVDYIGTRLHAGIYAMRHGVRSIILTIDERMNAMEGCIPNNCISRNRINELGSMIDSVIETEVLIDWNAIEKWKEQFE